MKHPRNSAKRRILEYLSKYEYVSANSLKRAGVVSVRSYRNVYCILFRLTTWGLASRTETASGLLLWSITPKGRERLNFYQRRRVGE